MTIFSRLLPALCNRTHHFVGLASLLFYAAMGSAHAAYTLSSGDVLNISVFGVPELQLKASVDVDGDISFPLVGKIKVGGSTTDQVRERLASLIANLGNNSNSARTLGKISPEEVSVSVAEYRPIYITGDVSHSGTQAFQPGLTVRQAIALAGGVDPTRGRSPGPGFDEFTTLWIDFAHEKGRVWRLEQEVGLSPASDQEAKPPATVPSSAVDALKSDLSGVPIPTGVVSQIIAAEVDQLEQDQVSVAKERTYLKSAKEKVQSQLDLLLQQQTNQKNQQEQSLHDYGQLQSLYAAHLATLDRLTAARRDGEGTANQLLQTSSLIVQTQRELDDLQQRWRQFESTRQVTTTRELEEARLALAKISAKMKTIGDTASEPSNASDRAHSDVVAISIIRSQDGTEKTVEATGDMAVVPGDTIQVKITKVRAALTRNF